jgi:hypothetical protein
MLNLSSQLSKSPGEVAMESSAKPGEGDHDDHWFAYLGNLDSVARVWVQTRLNVSQHSGT